MRVYLLLCFCCVVFNGSAQNQKLNIPPATKATDRLQSFVQRQQLEENSLVRNVPFRSVGPTIMSGRIVDIDVSPTDPTHFYAAYASGGLWKTTNNGISFAPVFDQEAVMTIGDIAVDWEKDETIWVGTGENNSSRSSYAGTGIYKSQDGGKTWQHLGLPESHHIGRIILHPSNPNIAWVAVMGHLYSPNKERGIYKTLDGGKTWEQTLFVNENTGGVDLALDPNNPEVIYSATWERERRAWNFVENGPGTGIYKSTNGGKSWKKINTIGSGFPAGSDLGRIGLAVYPQNPNIIYAIVDNQARRSENGKETDKTKLTKNQLRSISKNQFLQLENSKLADFLAENFFPKQYTATSIKSQVRRDQLKPIALVEYLEDANTQMFDRPVIGAEVYRSDDGGITWKRTHVNYLDDVYYSFGYYFGQIRVTPNQPDKIYIFGVPILTSADGGKTFKSLDAENVHADHHALWINGNRPGHLINGNDGGINISYDDGATWFKANTPAVGQFYTINVDMEMPYNIYGGLQDNGVWMGPSNYQAGSGWTAEGSYPYKRLLGGDGMQVAIDTRDNTTIYTGSQYGNYVRLNRKTGERLSIRPKHQLGQRPLRFNWQTPIHLSRHNQDVIYLGSNKFHRSLKKGEDMQTLSGDLTNGGRPGDVGYGTLTTIDESPLQFGLLYTGSDDGIIQVSRDGGNTWNRISDKLPQSLWVSRLTASNHRLNRVYASLNGYRWDDFTPYLFVSDDNGKNWLRIGENLPVEPINVVKEDPRNPQLLYVGTDHGLYISLDEGKTFMRMNKNMPAVAVHDLVVHPRNLDLVVGTHGRSVYVASLEHVQQLTDSLLKKPLHLFPVRPVYFNPTWGQKNNQWDTTAHKPEMNIAYYLHQPQPVTIRIKTEKGLLLKQLNDTGERGLNYVPYHLEVENSAVGEYEKYLKESRSKEDKEINIRTSGTDTIFLKPGKYLVEIEADNNLVNSQLFSVLLPEKINR